MQHILSEKQKKYFLPICIVSLFASVLEITTISSIFPFMSLVTSPEKVHAGYYAQIYNLFHFDSPRNFIILLGVIIIILFTIKTVFSSFSNYISLLFAHKIARSIKVKLLDNYLNEKYIYYVRSNRSAVSEIHNIINVIASAIISVFTAITEVFIVIAMYIILMLFNWKIMLFITMFFVLNIFVVNKFLHPLLHRISHQTWVNGSIVNKYLYAIVHNYKLIKLSTNKINYVHTYEKMSTDYHEYEAKRGLLERQPKNMLELSGFIIMVGLIIYQEIAHGTDSSSNFIPMISLLMLTFYRLLPSVTKIIEAKNTLVHVSSALDRVNHELAKITEVKPSNMAPIKMLDKFELHDIKFNYLKKKSVLSGVSLQINRGEHVAFIGSSGSGKSTLVDIIMGFYPHDESLYHFAGSILVDGVALSDAALQGWRKNIGYIPQEIYLFDGTVAENIVMNTEYNEERVVSALKKAYIWDFLEQKEGIHTHVGDGGVMLSGGQKQRIGIARALYNDPDIIVMDEATSALDDYTESQIIEELNNSAREKTIIMIAHRISSLKNCDRIYKLDHGVIVNEFTSIEEIN